MPESKQMSWVDGFGKDADNDPKAEKAPVRPDEPAANDADGWKQYRRWISKAPAPRGRRNGIDPSLYTWKGYREWSDQVKRNWARDNDSD